MFSFKGIGVKYFALFMALVALAGGIYLSFFHSSGFVKTEALIVDVEYVPSDDGDGNYAATVEYTVDGKTYTGVLDVQSSTYKVGKTVNVLYDPNDPAVVHSGGHFGLYLFIVGIAILAALAGTQIKKNRALQEVRDAQEAAGDAGYAPSVPGPQRQLYFLSDLGTAKGGHRIEDESGRVLYEAKMTRFTLTAPYGFDFIDHEHGKTLPHLVGHEEASEPDHLSLLFDNHYTFSFDGEDIWKHLRKNGVSVDSRLNARARTEYRILRDGKEIALAVSSSKNVREEASEESLRFSTLVPSPGFYRIVTQETDLGLLFVTLLAFARSGATDDRGGNRKTFLSK